LYVLYPFALLPAQTAAGIERAQTLKEEGNKLVKKGNHKKAIEKYSESLKLNQECATYTNRYCPSAFWHFTKATLVLLTQLPDVCPRQLN